MATEKPNTPESKLLDIIAAWDGKDAKMRDEIRARIWCWQNGYRFDSVMGKQTRKLDDREIFYCDNPNDMMGGGCYRMEGLTIWPLWNKFLKKPRRTLRQYLVDIIAPKAKP